MKRRLHKGRTFRLAITLAALTLLRAGADPSAVREFESRRDALAEGDVPGRAELARWAQRHGLDAEARALHEEVIALDPDHTAARRALGYVRQRGRWFKPWEKAWEVRTEHYAVRTTVSEACARACADRLEGLRAAVADLFGDRLTPAPGPLEVWIFDRMEDFRRVALTNNPQGNYPGFYGSVDGRAYFLWEDPAALAARDESPNEEILLHECTHQLLNRSIPMETSPAERPHFWVMEGIALHMETLRHEEGKAVLGNPAHLWARRAKAWAGEHFLPLERFVRMDQAEFASDRIVSNYAQAASLADFLLHGRGGEHREAFLDYCVAVHRGRATERAFRDSFGCESATLEDGWKSFVASR